VQRLHTSEALKLQEYKTQEWTNRNDKIKITRQSAARPATVEESPINRRGVIVPYELPPPPPLLSSASNAGLAL